MIQTKQLGLWLMVVLLALTGCQAVPASPTAPATDAPDLGQINRYLLNQARLLKNATSSLKGYSDQYYALAKEADFDYAALWAQKPAEVAEILEAARNAWIEASPLYEQMEGIVAGTPLLAEYDVILDAGASGAEDPAGAVPFDLTLPDQRVLPKPGNLFGVTESTLWGTDPAYVVAGVAADWNGNSALEFGEMLPDANVLKGSVDALDSYTAELLAKAEKWEPTLDDAFTALVVMVPTMSEYFASWRDSRFVSGIRATRRDFVAVSRLADILDILGGLQVVYAQLRPLAATVDAEQAAAVARNLDDLKAFVAELYAQEQEGRQFKAEEADIFGAEAQNRATAITGQISQLAAELGVEITD